MPCGGSAAVADARARVLAKIRRRMVPGNDAVRRETVAARLANPKPNLVPARGAGDDEHRIALFTRLMEGVGGTVERLDAAEDIPEAVARYLRGRNLPAAIRRGADPFLAKLPWHRAAAVAVSEGRAEDADKAALSHAFAGAAESATVILLSGLDNPTTLNFLPEAHIVVLEVKDLHGSYEESWSRLRKIHGRGKMPRTVNMISGPSRTGDVEQTIVRPAHGPKDMHVILVG
jgi:L-lactate dehydrogenase complex protein LldG